MFMETSAKAGHNVKSLFKKIAMELVGMEKETEAVDTQNTSMLHFVHRYTLGQRRPVWVSRNRRYGTINERRPRCVSMPVLIETFHAGGEFDIRICLSICISWVLPYS